MQWIKDVDKLEFFLWLYGPAGAGKSSIAQSIAELCDEAGILDASFFFSRTAAGRNNDRLLIPTLTYQLSQSMPDILQFVGEALNRDPLVFGRSLQAQIDTLLVGPLSQVAASRQDMELGSNSRPIFFIIDGLDECGEAKSQRYILSVLSSAIRSSAIPLFFLITSRPEQDIRQSFNAEPLNSLTRRLVLDDNYKPDEDIKVFLQSKFDDIKKDHPSKYFLPASWPSDSDVESLVKKSSGQFIYASTVMKFVDSTRHRPTERLNMILGLQPTGKNMPFAALDELYMHIFLAVADIEAVMTVFEVLFFFPSLSSPSIDDVEKFLCLMPGELQIILIDLHSIIAVPSPQDVVNRNLRLFHASLGDFLLDKSRSRNLFIDAQEAHAHMARYCIRHMPMPFLTRRMSNVFFSPSFLIIIGIYNRAPCCTRRPSVTFISCTFGTMQESASGGRTSARLVQFRF